MVEAQWWLSQSALCGLPVHPLLFSHVTSHKLLQEEGKKKKTITSVLPVSGAICGEEAVAPVAGQPRPAGTSGSGHVNPNVSHSDQLPQHQTDHSCVTCQERANNLRRIQGSGLNLPVPHKHELISQSLGRTVSLCEPGAIKFARLEGKACVIFKWTGLQGIISWGVLYAMVYICPMSSKKKAEDNLA